MPCKECEHKAIDINSKHCGHPLTAYSTIEDINKQPGWCPLHKGVKDESS